MSTTHTVTPKLVEPYLFFEGCCEEAIEFYRRTAGAEVIALMHYKESPDPEMCPSGAGEKVMHASFRIGNTNVMASDGRCSGKPNFQGFALSVAVSTEDEADRLFSALSEGGEVVMPIGKTFFSPRFGMLSDRFGVIWMVIVPG